MSMRAGFLYASLLAALAAGTGDAAQAAVSEDVKLLPHRRAILGAGSAAGWCEFREDSLLAAGASPDFRDLRVADATGEAIPFVLVPPRLHDSVLRRVDVPLDASGNPVAPLASAWSGDLSVGDTEPGSLRLTVSNDEDLGEWWIEVSQDGVTWTRAHPYRVREPRRPDAPHDRVLWAMAEQFRRVRFVTPGPADLAARGAEPAIHRVVEIPAPTESVPFTRVSSGFTGSTWRARYTLEGPSRALCGLTVRTDPAGLRLPERIEVVDERGVPRPVALSFTRVDSVTQRVAWSPVRGGEIVVMVPRSDPPNEPIEVTAIACAPARFRFQATGAALWAHYGDPYVSASAAAVEPEREEEEEARPVALALGPEEANPLHEPPGFGLRWLARRPNLLTAAMVATLAILLLVAWRTRPARREV